jgi:hypothetical protein
MFLPFYQQQEGSNTQKGLAIFFFSNHSIDDFIPLVK